MSETNQTAEGAETVPVDLEKAYFSSRGEDTRVFEQKPEASSGPADEPVGDGEQTGNTEEAKAAPEEPKQPQTVPLKALHEEREARKQAERQYRELLERMDARLNAPEPQPEAPKGPPDPEEDIFGAVKGTQAEINAVKAQLAEQAKREQQAIQFRQFYDNTRAQEEQFKKNVPDYNDALAHLRSVRVAELEEFGVTDPHLVEQDIAQQAQAIAANAMRMGKNPAELAYALAKKRGYLPHYNKEVLKSSLDILAEGDKAEARAASKTLSGSGSAPGGDMTAERLMKMPSEEFNSWRAKNPAKFRRLMGGG